MYLSKIFIKWPWGRDSYQLHRALWQLFPDQPDKTRDFLFRVESVQVRQGAMVLLQSPLPPCNADVAQVLASKALTYSFIPGAKLHFMLRGNPIKTIKDEKQRQNSHGEIKRCRVPLIREDEQIAWLQRKLSASASLDGVEIIQEEPLYFNKHSISGKIQPVCFKGILTVMDAAQFHHILLHGIGPAKAMGCGLLSVG